MHHLSLYFETTAKIPEVEFEGKYGYMRHVCRWYFSQLVVIENRILRPAVLPIHQLLSISKVLSSLKFK